MMWTWNNVAVARTHATLHSIGNRRIGMRFGKAKQIYVCTCIIYSLYIHPDASVWLQFADVQEIWCILAFQHISFGIILYCFAANCHMDSKERAVAVEKVQVEIQIYTWNLCSWCLLLFIWKRHRMASGILQNQKKINNWNTMRNS